MVELTKRQQEVLSFIELTRVRIGHSPTLREIATHFGFRSPKASADHVTALQRKGVLSNQARKARALRVISPWEKMLQPVMHIPVYGTIPAGFSQETEQQPDGCISVDVRTIGLRPSTKAFALQVRGESMIGKGILDGDMAVIEPDRTARAGDVVAALIDGESTLKTFITERGQPRLRAENPRYPKLIPANELVVQGVMVALIRKCP
ncbi:MAG TPA: transcriptional repressor LexA [Candidatus Limnocylindria bacterium]|nr:transcriptional repressor LexA [Candidatus Limnocylindria bacterium]